MNTRTVWTPKRSILDRMPTWAVVPTFVLIWAGGIVALGAGAHLLALALPYLLPAMVVWGVISTITGH